MIIERGSDTTYQTEKQLEPTHFMSIKHDFQEEKYLQLTEIKL